MKWSFFRFLRFKKDFLSLYRLDTNGGRVVKDQRRTSPRAVRSLLSRQPFRRIEPLESRVLLSGTVFATVIHDVNGNGVKDPEEPALDGWTV